MIGVAALLPEQTWTALFAMPSFADWSLAGGNWGGTRVRWHVSTLLFALGVLFLAWRADVGAAASERLLLAWLGLGVLALSLLLHEAGHWLAARRWGSRLEETVLAPWGGWRRQAAPDSPAAEAALHLAGPFVSLLAAAACAPAALAAGGVSLLDLLHPLAPEGLRGVPLSVSAWRFGVWINWLLCVVNLIPAAPFDGGAAMQAVLSRAFPAPGRVWAERALARAAQVGAVLLGVAAIAYRELPAGGWIPPWLALSSFGVLLLCGASPRPELVGARRLLESAPAAEVETAPPPRPPEALAADGPSRRERQREAGEERLRAREEDDERRLDEVLSRLHASGPAGLSAEDRALLQRVSARYRRRQGQNS